MYLYISSISFPFSILYAIDPKNDAKVLQNFELCKFFGKKIFLQFQKVVQNKIVFPAFTAFYNFSNVQKFSKIKSFQQLAVISTEGPEE